MSVEKEELRNIRLAVRFTRAERNELEARAAAAELPLADYLRTTTFGQTPGKVRAPSLNRQALAQALAALNEAGALLSRILSEVEVGDCPSVVCYTSASLKVEQAADKVLRALEAQ